jgi:hypothetical protein
MANKTAACRVCGKEFVPCSKSSAEIGAFNYREVACSSSCGQEYLRRVLEGRKPKAVEPEVEATEIVVDEPVAVQEEVNMEETPTYNKKFNKRRDISFDIEE